MLPSLFPDARLEVSAAHADRIRKGDVVCYPVDERNMTVHRVVGVERREGEIVFLTRGDAQLYAEEIPASAIAYRVERVEQRGVSYDVADTVGRAFCRIALSEGAMSWVVRRNLAWAASLWLRACKKYRAFLHTADKASF